MYCESGGEGGIKESVYERLRHNALQCCPTLHCVLCEAPFACSPGLFRARLSICYIFNSLLQTFLVATSCQIYLPWYGSPCSSCACPSPARPVVCQRFEISLTFWNLLLGLSNVLWLSNVLCSLNVFLNMVVPYQHQRSMFRNEAGYSVECDETGGDLGLLAPWLLW